MKQQRTIDMKKGCKGLDNCDNARQHPNRQFPWFCTHAYPQETSTPYDRCAGC